MLSSTGQDKAGKQGSGISEERGMDFSLFVYTHEVLKDPQGRAAPALLQTH